MHSTLSFVLLHAKEKRINIAEENGKRGVGEPGQFFLLKKRKNGPGSTTQGETLFSLVYFRNLSSSSKTRHGEQRHVILV
jgi:hypothetical protein